jgi:drug/metabolite transporter (DMT)-like permease
MWPKMDKRGTGISREAAGLWLGLLGVAIFAATLPFTRLAVGELGAGFLTAGRAAGAGIMAAIVLLIVRPRLPSRTEFWKLLLISICVVAAFPAFTAVAMTSVDASHGGVVLGVLPLATAAAGALLGRERPSLVFWLAAVAGAVVVTAFALLRGRGSLEAGDLLLAVAIVSAAIGYTYSGQLARTMPAWVVISWALVLALPLAVPLAVLWWPDDISSLQPQTWAAFAYVTVMSQYVGFFAWNAGLAIGGVARVSQVQLLQSFFTLGIAAILNSERVGLETWATAITVVLIVLVSRRLKVRAPR